MSPYNCRTGSTRDDTPHWYDPDPETEPSYARPPHPGSGTAHHEEPEPSEEAAHQAHYAVATPA